MQKIVEFITQSWDTNEIIFIYKRSKFRIFLAELSEEARDLVESHIFDVCQFKGIGYMNKGLLVSKSIVLEVLADKGPIHLKTHKYVETEYVEYSYGSNNIKVQRNGFMVYCAPTGQGKTYFALMNLKELSKQCDTILYINLELSVDDLYNRIIKMGIEIPDNVYVAPMEQVKLIEEWAQNKGKIILVVDNIDNLVGGGDDPFGEQLEYIKKLDRWLKDNNHHGLILTQLVKDSNTNLLGKDGLINDALNTNILSGVKQLSYLSRTVMMTAYSPHFEKYDYKILKVGSAIINE